MLTMTWYNCWSAVKTVYSCPHKLAYANFNLFCCCCCCRWFKSEQLVVLTVKCDQIRITCLTCLHKWCFFDLHLCSVIQPHDFDIPWHLCVLQSNADIATLYSCDISSLGLHLLYKMDTLTRFWWPSLYISNCPFFDTSTCDTKIIKCIHLSLFSNKDTKSYLKTRWSVCEDGCCDVCNQKAIEPIIEFRRDFPKQWRIRCSRFFECYFFIDSSIIGFVLFVPSQEFTLVFYSVCTAIDRRVFFIYFYWYQYRWGCGSKYNHIFYSCRQNQYGIIRTCNRYLFN